MKTYPRRILLAVTGMTPQIVTETAWALMTEKGFVPTEIRLITTEHGKNRAMRDLLDPEEGRFHAFCRDCGCEGAIDFTERSIQVIRNRTGEPLTDIRTPDDNARAADEIMRTVRQLCSDPEARVHVSIAGGRKSMGFFAGYAMSFFARPQDSISHVLVSESFEGNSDFFYPAPRPHEILTREGRPLNTVDARVMLAEIPIVRLREGLPDELLNGDASFSAAVRAAQAAISPAPELRFSKEPGIIICGGVELRLTPIPYVVYRLFAERAAQGHAPVRPGELERERMLELHDDLFPSRFGDLDLARKSLKHEEDVLPYFQEKRSEVNRKLREALGKRAAEPYLIQPFGKRPMTGYGLALPAGAVYFD